MAGFLARAAVGVVVGAAMAGCGSIGSSGAGAGGSGQLPSTARVASTSLCADPTAVSQVKVARIPSVAQLEPSKPGQNRVFTITVTDHAKARELARAICSLPPMRHGAMRCPFDARGGYQLWFSARNRHLPLVSVEAAGCLRVTGADRPRLAGSSGFWTVLARTTGIQAPAHSG